MGHPTLEDARELSEWRPPLGAISVYVRFDPADRRQAWRAELRNEASRILEAEEGADHERRMALRETARRLLRRFEDEIVRPPPRGEAGFLEIARHGGAERWWGTAVAPTATRAVLDEHPAVATLVDLSARCEPVGVALASSERIRLLRFAEGVLENLEDWEITIWSEDWRERKSPRTSDPARGQGVSASGHDRYGERLDHNRRRFLAESGSAAGRRFADDDLGRVIAFGPAADLSEFLPELNSSGARPEIADEADLISMPAGELVETVAEAVERLAANRDRELAERALGESDGAPGATGIEETGPALEEGRVDHLLLDPSIGDRAEPLVRTALTRGARVTVARDGVAELLAPVGGVAGILRY